MGDNSGKLELIPHTLLYFSLLRRGVGKWGIFGPHAIGVACVGLACWWGNGLTKATIYSWSERTISHTGTETRSRLLREAAVGNLGQWAQA